MTKITKTIALSIGATLIMSTLTGCTSTPSQNAEAPEATTAAELTEKCHQEILEIEKQITSTNNPSTKSSLCKTASEKAVNCHKTGMEFPDSTDLAKLGKDTYHETTNYLCYCTNGVAAREIALDREGDPISRWGLLNEKLDFIGECYKGLSSDLHAPGIVPQMGKDYFGETSNLKTHCAEIIDDLKTLIDETDCPEKEELIDKLEEVDIGCQKLWTHILIDQSKAPANLFADPYNTAKYYKITCEYPFMVGEFPGDDPKSGDPVRDAFLICMKAANSRLSHILDACHAKYGPPAIGSDDNYYDLADCYREDPDYQKAAAECGESSGCWQR